MIRFECEKCGSLVVTEKGTKTVICGICGKEQNIPEFVIEDNRTVTKNHYDPQWDHYARLLYRARKYRDIKILTETAEEFDRLGEYEDSRAMAEFCRNRIAEEQVKRTAEAKEQEIRDRRKKKAGKIYHIKMAALNIGVVVLAILITMISNSIIKKPNYEDGLAYMEQGNYEQAIRYLEQARNYKDSKELLKQCQNAILDEKYNAAVLMMENGHYIAAKEEFKELEDYKDSATMIIECDYRQACYYLKSGYYQRAMEQFYAVIDYKDAKTLFETAKSKLTE